MDVPSDHSGDDAELVYRREGEETAAEGVLAAVGELTGTDPAVMDPLYDAIDPEALNALYARGPDREQAVPQQVSFQFNGCAVVVYGDGRIAVSRLQ